MMTQTRAIVLRNVRYGDNSLIVDMLTERHGRMSFVIRLSKSSRGKMRRQLFHPLSLLELDFDLRTRSTLQRLHDVRISFPLPSLLTHPYKLTIGLFLAEFLSHATQDESENPLLYQFVENSLQWLEGKDGRFSNFHLVFMIKLSRFIGFLPNTEDYHENDYFDMLNGCFCSKVPLHSHFLVAADAAKINLLMRLEYSTMHLVSMSRADRDRCLDVILEYYRLHVPGFPELKSYPVLKELFAR